MRPALAACVLALLPLATACGVVDDARPGEDGRPSVQAIAGAIKDPGNSFHQAFAMFGDDTALDCVAEALHDSDLSDDALRALVDDDTDFAYNKGDDKALGDVTDEMASCINA
jgi:hypothetical protein